MSGGLNAANGYSLTALDSADLPRYRRNMPGTQTDQDRVDGGGSRFVTLRWTWGLWAIPASLSGFNTYFQYSFSGKSPDWHWLLFNSMDWFIYAFLTPFVFRLSRRFPLGRGSLRKYIWFHIAAALSMCVAWAGLGTVLRWAIFPVPADASLHTYLQGFVSWIFTTLPFGVGVYFALVGIDHSLFFFKQVREQEMQAAQLTAQLSEARLNALRMQLNPHFLFNSLNAITVLVRDQDTVAAVRMLELLSDVLRQVLRADSPHETTLSKELDFLSRYLAIEQIRFSDRLRLDIQIDQTVSQALVPIFLLQPLVENAIRHGIASRAGAGVIEISGTREGKELIVSVRDDGKRLSDSASERELSGEGIGLANTRGRLKSMYGEAASLDTRFAEGSGFIATLRLPYREDTGTDEDNPNSRR